MVKNLINDNRIKVIHILDYAYYGIILRIIYGIPKILLILYKHYFGLACELRPFDSYKK